MRRILSSKFIKSIILIFLLFFAPKFVLASDYIPRGYFVIDLKNKVEWIRANQLCATGKMYLFQDGIEPSDVVQGALGDCWLMAALAALAEFPGAIENCSV